MSYEAIHKKLVEAIKKRGETGIRDLARIFKIFDDDGNNKLSKMELRKGLGDYGLRLTQGEIDIIFARYDRDKDGGVNFDEFLYAIRGKMNAARVQVVQRAFKKFDKTGDGVVTVEDLKGVYNARNHPEVTSGKKTEVQVLQQFLQNFDNNKDGTVTYEEFEEYYNGVSASIDDDGYFSLMMYNAWKL